MEGVEEEVVIVVEGEEGVMEAGVVFVERMVEGIEGGEEGIAFV